ncbi:MULTISPECIES: CLCA_X family protein [unclassified Agarivorans]|uniref:CLCA_X family protein n=1 Tax=unclassified Agarivorans TaxID=2636026 RepID=UPI0026E351B6|nr:MULTISPECIES: CLCA_X family protein [unclassified Agarivorans]MDO6687888.1 hypothetical protein [Agarivorans sp. 3_MG-2023]MDO6717510.1 hypothetical protein [Agarivorans sp. 2_MG-2023]
MNASHISRLRQNHYRKGPDYRFGDDVSFGEVREQFGLLGVTVGRWVSREEQQIAANLIFDAMADLAFVLNVPPVLIGLRGQLRLAFGHGGNPTVQAHYAPASRTLALAKNAGSGALAHEWIHGFDNHVADKAFVNGGDTFQFASQRWIRNEVMKPHPLNDALAELFGSVFTPTTEAHGNFVKQALVLDKELGRCYFSEPTELFARAFEAVIQYQSEIKNQYLVSGTQKSEMAKMGAYPTLAHLSEIKPTLLNYFALLGRLI